MGEMLKYCDDCKGSLFINVKNCPKCGKELITTNLDSDVYDRLADLDRIQIKTALYNGDDAYSMYIEAQEKLKQYYAELEYKKTHPQPNATNYSDGGLIKWIKNCFEGMISILFVISIIGFAIGGLIIGQGLSRASGGTNLAFFGLILGTAIGIVLNVVLFGFFATIIQISKTNEKILQYLNDKAN